MSDICHKAVGNTRVVHPQYKNIEGWMIKCNYGLRVDVDPPAASRKWKNVTCKRCLQKKHKRK